MCFGETAIGKRVSSAEPVAATETRAVFSGADFYLLCIYTVYRLEHNIYSEYIFFYC